VQKKKKKQTHQEHSDACVVRDGNKEKGRESNEVWDLKPLSMSVESWMKWLQKHTINMVQKQ